MKTKRFLVHDQEQNLKHKAATDAEIAKLSKILGTDVQEVIPDLDDPRLAETTDQYEFPPSRLSVPREFLLKLAKNAKLMGLLAVLLLATGCATALTTEGEGGHGHAQEG